MHVLWIGWNRFYLIVLGLIYLVVLRIKICPIMPLTTAQLWVLFWKLIMLLTYYSFIHNISKNLPKWKRVFWNPRKPGVSYLIMSLSNFFVCIINFLLLSDKLILDGGLRLNPRVILMLSIIMSLFQLEE